MPRGRDPAEHASRYLTYHRSDSVSCESTSHPSARLQTRTPRNNAHPACANFRKQMSFSVTCTDSRFDTCIYIGH